MKDTLILTAYPTCENRLYVTGFAQDGVTQEIKYIEPLWLRRTTLQTQVELMLQTYDIDQIVVAGQVENYVSGLTNVIQDFEMVRSHHVTTEAKIIRHDMFNDMFKGMELHYDKSY